MHFRVIACCAITLVVFARSSVAQHLPLATYTVAQGLPGNDVTAVVEDAYGHLWIGTSHGLSRFDGKEFRTFGRERGLDDERVTGLILGGDDRLWVSTPRAVYVFEFSNGLFREVPVEGRSTHWERTKLVLDRAGRLWCGADGLYLLDGSREQPVLRRMALPENVSLPVVTAFGVDPAGDLWLAYQDIYRRRSDGRFERVAEISPPLREITSLAADRRGRVWITAEGGFWVIEPCVEIASCRPHLVLGVEEIEWASPIWGSSDHVWLGTATGLLELDAQDRLLRRISTAHGLLAANPMPLFFDRHGDLWIAFGLGGLQRLVANGLISFGREQGLQARPVNAILRTRADELVVIGPPYVERLDHDRFRAIRPKMPAAIRGPGWGWNQIDFQDRTGGWWIATQNGVVRFPSVRRLDDLARPPAVELLAWRGCFRGQDIFRLYEDSRSDLWIGTIEMYQPTLHRWNRTTGTIDCFRTAPLFGYEVAPTAFLDDGRGTLWIGFYQGQIVRYREGGFTCVIDCVNPSQGNVTGIILDRRGRLWIATNRSGVLRIDDPAKDVVDIRRFTIEQGLTSNRTRAVLEDAFDRIYVGTDLGVDVLDADGRRIGHYGVEEGLPHPFINTAWRDSNGDLWFGTLNGVARLQPSASRLIADAARVLIDAVRVAGVPRTVAASGEADLTGVTLEPDQRNLEVEYVVLPRDLSSTLRFQSRLSDSEPWSPPTSNRTIVFAGLSAGDYRLQVRAVDTIGQPVSLPASLSFRVLAPVFRRGWFVALVAIALTGLLSAIYRWRVSHLTALERQRTRIAMDLHDEMGSRLGSIGLLADLAADQAPRDTPERARLEHIAETAADIGSSLAEIVWSLRRGATTLEGVTRHVVFHGHRLFPGPTTFAAKLPERWPAKHMSLGVSRAVLLISLEALHNCARHAQAQSVVLELRQIDRRWSLTITDDGCGIAREDSNSSESGFGLETMRRRAAEIGGILEIDSRNGHGTSVRLTFDPDSDVSPPRMIIRSTWNRIWATGGPLHGASDRASHRRH